MTGTGAQRSSPNTEGLRRAKDLFDAKPDAFFREGYVEHNGVFGIQLTSRQRSLLGDDLCSCLISEEVRRSAEEEKKIERQKAREDARMAKEEALGKSRHTPSKGGRT